MILTMSYAISDILNNSKVFSVFRADVLHSQGKAENVVDDTVLSDEDESICKKYLKIGATEVANVISGYAKNLLDTDGVTELEPFEFDVTYNAIPNSIVFRANLPETFQTAILALMDESFKDALENYILYRVNKLKGIEFQSYQADYETALSNIRKYVHRRTQSTIRNYNNLV